MWIHPTNDDQKNSEQTYWLHSKLAEQNLLYEHLEENNSPVTSDNDSTEEHENNDEDDCGCH